MLRAIEDEDFARNSLRRDQVWVLRHVPRAVDLAVMVNFLNNLYPRRWWETVATQFPAFVVIVGTIKFISPGGRVVTFGDLDSGDLEIVLGLPGGVSAEEEAVSGVGFGGVPI